MRTLFLARYRSVLLAAVFLMLAGPSARAFELICSPGDTSLSAVYFNGSAKQLSDRFQLTPYANDQEGALVLDGLPKTPIRSFEVQFGLRMTNEASTSVMADGFSFNFGPGLTLNSVTSEKGIAQGLAVSFDTFKNNTAPYFDPDWVPGISIRWDGSDVVFTNISGTFDA